ncbi:type II secretion system ATPase GspE [Thorsellia anophelis]|uniref:Type II secretion system protein E n=1 Tax=Thorsellia anophelis DSM 18579 TaxID=1123402 RepID=A0A1I0AVM8_9GAMM|nr:type II secretion system ATPase GspE [Thorsellia anophelis]SES98424.1 general secretion pathway protein E [Thorsellia anophelis DSM 18579]
MSWILPYSYAEANKVVLKQFEGKWVLAYRPPLLHKCYREITRYLGMLPLEFQALDESEFAQTLVTLYQQDSSEAQLMMQEIGNQMDFYALAEDIPEHDDLLNNDEDAPIIKLINAMLSEAIKVRASDIHIETFEKSLSIRFRVDGVLREILQPQRKLAALLVSRIKVMAKLDIAEKRIPQDGRISLRIGGRAIDVRVSTLPSNHAERVVLRLLDKHSVVLDLAKLGMRDAHLKAMKTTLLSPHGIILVTGPTGSGKSTTLYAALSQLNSKERNILTVEDPIEYDLEGIGQTQVNNKVDMTFARGLRAILRQDPDVVMVGEIRDTETAKIAVQASLTGHLVLSTLHTNSAIGAITRLQDMGVEPFLLSTSLVAVVAQRLVRTLCSECKIPYEIDEATAAAYDLAPKTRLHRAGGCEACQMTGYSGRTGIHELIIVNEVVRQAIYRNEGEEFITKAIRQTSPDLRREGLSKAELGITSLEEVISVTRDDK